MLLVASVYLLSLDRGDWDLLIWILRLFPRLGSLSKRRINRLQIPGFSLPEAIASLLLLLNDTQLTKLAGQPSCIIDELIDIIYAIVLDNSCKDYQMYVLTFWRWFYLIWYFYEGSNTRGFAWASSKSRGVTGESPFFFLPILAVAETLSGSGWKDWIGFYSLQCSVTSGSRSKAYKTPVFALGRSHCDKSHYYAEFQCCVWSLNKSDSNGRL